MASVTIRPRHGNGQHRGSIHLCERVHDCGAEPCSADPGVADVFDREFAGELGGLQALLPKDANENYSAVAYQNLSPVLTPLLSQLSGETADAVRELARMQGHCDLCAGEETASKRQRQPSFWL